MAATDKLPKDLKNRIFHFYKHFLKAHNTRSVREKMPKKIDDLETIGDVLNLFNAKISWSNTDYGYSYYYALNIRWVIGISYLCHELYPSLDGRCIDVIEKFLRYHNSDCDEDRYNKMKRIYSQKVEKIKEIFGN